MTNNIPKQSQCAALFGNPASAGWVNIHIAHVETPWQLVMGDIHIPYIKINKVAADSLRRVIDKTWEACNKETAKIEQIHADQFSGDWVIRQMRGLHTISMHAYGLAVDFDAPHNHLGASTHFFTPANPLVQAFQSEGWTWGGTWAHRPDAMHFQYATVG